MAKDSDVLPYRSDADEVIRWVEARARGRGVDQIRALGYSEKSYEGTVATARALGLIDSQTSQLTPWGRDLALLPADGRRELLRESILRYDPYSLLLEALFLRDLPAVTELTWIETWWATHGYGTSESNRAEGATVFARLIEYVGLGTYVQGRRGHPTRIEWKPGTEQKLVPGEPPALPARSAMDTDDEPSVPGADAEPVADDVVVRRSQTEPRSSNTSAGARVSTITIEFRPGRVAHITVPSVLTSQEKARLLSLLDLAISVGPGS